MNRKQKIFLWINLFLVFLICVGNYFYLSRGGMRLQAFCSGIFVLMGIINLVYAVNARDKNLKFNIMMAIGLVCAFLADMTMAADFIIGVKLLSAMLSTAPDSGSAGCAGNFAACWEWFVQLKGLGRTP